MEQMYKCEDKSMDLLFSILNFKPRNSFYLTVEDKLQHLEDLLDTVPFTEAIALSWYASKVMGMRLAPTLALTRLACQTDKPCVERQQIKGAMQQVFTRPSFLANSFNYLEDRIGVTMKETPSWLKHHYTKILESYSDITLKKCKMENKELKLADLIKVLRPNPNKANIKNKNLYKAIIEKTSEASLVETESITTTLSSTELLPSQKQKVLQENLSTMAINEIIRNLSNIQPTQEALNIVRRRLTEITQSRSAMRYLNPYDLVFVDTEVDQKWLELADDILVEWVKKIFNGATITEKYNILLDVSGSMRSTNFSVALKFLAVLKPVLQSANLYLYNTKVFQIKDIDEAFHSTIRPNEFVKTCYDLSNYCQGGTYTIKSVKEVMKNNSDNLIVITDEYTYDSDDETELLGELDEIRGNRKLIVYNSCWSGSGAFKFDGTILRASGYQAQLLSAIGILSCFDLYKRIIIQEFVESL